MKFHGRRYNIARNVAMAVLILAGASRCAGNEEGRRDDNARSDADARGGQVLVIRKSGSRTVYGEWPLEEQGEFAIEFVHSVNQSPVREFFRVEDGMIRPFAARFFSFGAGMQSDLEEGQTLSRDGDAMVISGFFAARKELSCIVGTVSDHLLFINGETVSLRELCGRNAHITIRAERQKLK